MFTSKDLKKLIIPLIFEQLLAVSVGFVDTFMVSIAGEAAVSGVALVDNISNLLIQILSALATGGAVTRCAIRWILRGSWCCCMQSVSWK